MDDRIQRTIDRLKALDLVGKDSNERLSAICTVLYQPEYGWTRDACEKLCQILIDWLEQFDPEDWADEYLAEQGLVRLPKDADGEVIHIGDELISNHSKKTFVVTRFQYSRKHAWMVGGADKDDLSKYGLYAPRETRHYHKTTMEDVLCEFINAWFNPMYEGNVVAEYAEKLREVMADE